MFNKIKILTAAAALVCALSVQFATAAEWANDGRSAAQIEAQPLREGVRNTMQPENFNRNDRTISNEEWRQNAAVERPSDTFAAPHAGFSAPAVPTHTYGNSAVDATFGPAGGQLAEPINNHMLPNNFNRNDRTVSNDTWYERESVVR